jgi:hypothetical protein
MPRDYKQHIAQQYIFQEYVGEGLYPLDWSDGVSIVVPGAEFDY